MLNPRGTCTPKSKCEWECCRSHRNSQLVMAPDFWSRGSAFESHFIAYCLSLLSSHHLHMRIILNTKSSSSIYLLWDNSADGKLMIFFSQKIGFHAVCLLNCMKCQSMFSIICNLSPKKTNCTKCQSIFSGKKKKKQKKKFQNVVCWIFLTSMLSNKGWYLNYFWSNLIFFCLKILFPNEKWMPQLWYECSWHLFRDVLLENIVLKLVVC